MSKRRSAIEILNEKAVCQLMGLSKYTYQQLTNRYHLKCEKMICLQEVYASTGLSRRQFYRKMALSKYRPKRFTTSDKSNAKVFFYEREIKIWLKGEKEEIK